VAPVISPGRRGIHPVLAVCSLAVLGGCATPGADGVPVSFGSATTVAPASAAAAATTSGAAAATLPGRATLPPSAGAGSATAVTPAAGLGPGAALGRRLFPASNAWNTRVDAAPLDPASATLIASIGAGGHLHPDFGANLDGAPFGIPYVVVAGTQARVPVTFEYADESDPGPYPLPPDAPVEGGAASRDDRHVIVVDRDHQKLYELYDAHPLDGGRRWRAGAGAVFDLRTGAPRPAGWTSADAAGLPILAGLVRYDEVSAGHIDHALRFNVSRTRRAYVAPARHYASSDPSPALPPMGARLRLKASFDVSRFPPQARVVLVALQRYGMIVADNGGDWFLSGTPDRRWSDDQLNTLKSVPGSAFEVVRMGPVTTG
jgi:hypothetical protein